MDQAQIMHLACQQVRDSHASQSGRFGASLDVSTVLAALEKYGPKLISSLTPLGAGVNSATIAAVLVNLVHDFLSDPAATA